MFREVPERKKTIKTSAQKTPKICLFPNGLVHGFFSKNGHFINFCFYAKWIKKKCFLNFLKEMKAFWTIKRCVEKNPKFAFFQRG